MRSKLKVHKSSKAIQSIYDSFGGTRRAAKICGYSAELLSNWKRKGRVPLGKVAEISRSLCCHPTDLNHLEVSNLVTAIDEAFTRKKCAGCSG